MTWTMFHFGVVLAHIRIESEDLQSKSPSSVGMKKNTEQKKIRTQTLFTKFILQKMLVNAANHLNNEKQGNEMG